MDALKFNNNNNNNNNNKKKKKKKKKKIAMFGTSHTIRKVLQAET
jgi:hypothetical protein